MAPTAVLRRFYVLILLLAFSCNPQNASDQASWLQLPSSDLDLIKKRGYLVALVDNNSFSYFYFKGGAMGFEYELLKRFTDHINVNLRIKVITSIEQAVQLLEKGAGDIIAFPLTITTDRKSRVDFTEALFNTHQVLVQRKPPDWRDNPHLAEKKMIRNPVDLIGKDVYVKYGSAFKTRLENLSQEIGGEIRIIEDSDTSQTESLIRQVAEGEIDYTVTDETIARVNAAYYSNLDVNTMISLPQRIAWAVRKDSPKLLKTLNAWLSVVKRDGTLKVIYDRYFNSPRTTVYRRTSDFSSLGGNKISPYDEKIKEKAAELGWDWRLLAAMIYQESSFQPAATSWAGAKGLMQLMPSTGKYYGAKNLLNPYESINAGVNFLKFLDRQWSKTVHDPNERIKFMLASYNVGFSHVLDARNLTRKYGGNPVVWDGHVEKYLLLKSNPRYYRDPVVKAGYCRCEEPVHYVQEILRRYEEYQLYIKV